MRKALSRQHAKDIMDYTRQIHAKDRELDALRKKLGKVCVCVRTCVRDVRVWQW